MTTKRKTDEEVDPLVEATVAKEEAEKARIRANHSAAAVLVANDAHAASIARAAEHRVEADNADTKAKDAAARARVALEKSLGITSMQATPTLPAPQPPPATEQPTA